MSGYVPVDLNQSPTPDLCDVLTPGSKKTGTDWNLLIGHLTPKLILSSFNYSILFWGLTQVGKLWLIWTCTCPI